MSLTVVDNLLLGLGPLQVTAKLTGPAVHAFQQAQAQQQPLTAAFSGSSSSSSTDGQLAAALGTKWGHAVNVRLVLERRGDTRVVTVSEHSSKQQHNKRTSGPGQ